MRIKPEEKTKVEQEISSNFPGYSFSPAPAEKQGQNGYCYNYLLDKNDEKFILKVIFFDKIEGDLNKEQVSTEIAVYRAVRSSHVVNLLEHKTTEKYAFLLFKLLQGKTLGQRMSEGVFTEDEIKDIGTSLLFAVSDIFRKSKIVHQDIKPNNIFLTDDNEIKLLDFGAARYRVSPYRGTARRNFAYASPEQILTSHPSTIQGERKVIDDRSDVFSIGILLYELIEGKHPFAAKNPGDEIIKGKPPALITRLGISSGLKEVVYAMLSYKTSQRPHASRALASLQQGELVTPPSDKGKFYYCDTNGTSRFMELAEKYPDLFDGVVAEAAQIPQDQRGRTELLKASNVLIVDPQTYLFQKPTRFTTKFKKLPYYSFNQDIGDGAAFVASFQNNEGRINDFAREVINFQLETGATSLVMPFFYIEDFTDVAWSVDQQVTEAALKYVKENALPHPVIKGVALQQGVLTSSSKDNLIEYLTSLEDISGFLVLLDSGHSEVIVDEPWLKSAKDFFTQLQGTGKSVIWSRADISGLVMAHSSLSLAMGEALSSRKFDIDSERPGGGNQTPQIYLPQLFVRAKWPEAMKALKMYEKYNELACVDGCCVGHDFQSLNGRDIRDLALHMLCQFGKQFKKYAGVGGTSKALADIKKAKKHFENLKNSNEFLIKEALRKRDIKPTNATFLDSWLNTLHNGQ